MASVLFVCLGNICRSPTAHGVFAHKIEQAGLASSVTVDSCGTSHWHIGEPSDVRSAQEAALRGYDMSALRGRQIQATDFRNFDYILAMDHSNIQDLEEICPAEHRHKISLLPSFQSGQKLDEVPDPYYSSVEGFDKVFQLETIGISTYPMGEWS